MLMSAAIGRIGLVIHVTGPFVLVGRMSVIGVLTMMRLAGFTVLLMIGQLADFVTFAGPEKHQGGGGRDGGRLAEK